MWFLPAAASRQGGSLAQRRVSRRGDVLQESSVQLGCSETSTDDASEPHGVVTPTWPRRIVLISAGSNAKAIWTSGEHVWATTLDQPEQRTDRPAATSVGIAFRLRARRAVRVQRIPTVPTTYTAVRFPASISPRVTWRLRSLSLRSPLARWCRQGSSVSRKTRSNRSSMSRWLTAIPQKNIGAVPAAQRTCSNAARVHTHRCDASQRAVRCAGCTAGRSSSSTQPAISSVSIAWNPRRVNSAIIIDLPEPGLPVTR